MTAGMPANSNAAPCVSVQTFQLIMVPATVTSPSRGDSNIAADAAKCHCIENQRVPYAGSGAQASTARASSVQSRELGRSPRLAARL